jgi:hypothetical protein
MARGAKPKPGAETSETEPAPKPARKPRAAKPKAPPPEPSPEPPPEPPVEPPVEEPAYLADKPLEIEAKVHSPCANCGTPLIGHYCHECGQQAHLHNKLSHLLHEFVEGVAHFDGRLWRTLPVLTLNPGRLSREWIEGTRARYVAPLHVFLFAVFLMFTIMSLHIGAEKHPVAPVVINEAHATSPSEQAAAMRQMRQQALEALKKPDQQDGPSRWANQTLADFFGFAASRIEHADYYGYKIKTLLYKLSFLTPPLAMAILWLLLLYKRRYSLYDHGVVALYGLGFLALVWGIGLLFPGDVRGLWVFAMMIVVPIHAVRHLKVAYGMGWPAAIIVGVMMGFLTTLSLVAFIIAVAALGLAG